MVLFMSHSTDSQQHIAIYAITLYLVLKTALFYRVPSTLKGDNNNLIHDNCDRVSDNDSARKESIAMINNNESTRHVQVHKIYSIQSINK